ncbi:MAG TPA: PfkB family carbohydrate kinase [Desulfomonilaceae bacterium]|nr:PfkB family carbohydrate kinase [Desulfomonilaceae bacterium]
MNVKEGYDTAPYDIVFVGHTAIGKIVPFKGSPHVETGGPAPYAAMAAARCMKRVALITRLAKNDSHLLEPLKTASIDVYMQPAEATTHIRIVHPSANPDEREMILINSSGFFKTEEMPQLEPCLVHLAGMSNQEFTMEFMVELRRRGFSLSLDMQSFVLQVEDKTGHIHLKDVPEKQEIIAMADIVKLDVAEAGVLTGSDDLYRAAAMIEEWGCPEAIITRADGVLAHVRGLDYFAPFSNRSIAGRSGRGDTTIAAYLTQRMSHPVEYALEFAAAMASIKMETPGPYMGTMEDVLVRMRK